MAFDQTAHQGEPDTEARIPAPRTRICLDEEIEDVRQDIRGNADARVANAHRGLVLFPFHGQLDLASGFGVLRRVDEQIHKYLLQSGGVGLQPHGRIREYCGHSVIALLHGEFDGLRSVSRDGAQIDSCALQAQVAASDP